MKYLIVIIIGVMLISNLLSEIVLVDTFYPEDVNILKSELYDDSSDLNIDPYLRIYYKDGREEIKYFRSV